MSTMPPGLAPPADESRLELAMAAMRSERRNRPRALPVLALLVLAVAVGYLVWTFTLRATAATRLSRATSSLGSIEGVIGQLQAMQAQRDDPKYDPQNDMVGRLQRYATSTIGLPRVEVQQKDPTTSATVKGFTKRVYTTIVADADPALLLEWVTKATDGQTFPGLEIEQIKLTPGRTLEDGKVAWTLDIAFRRWERQP
jgi:hypothetical protein